MTENLKNYLEDFAKRIQLLYNEAKLEEIIESRAAYGRAIFMQAEALEKEYHKMFGLYVEIDSILHASKEVFKMLNDENDPLNKIEKRYNEIRKKEDSDP